MNCNEFHAWLQQTLDDRGDLQSNDDAALHVADCQSCKADLDTWSSIAYSVSESQSELAIASQVHSRYREMRWVRSVGAIAAATLFAVVMMWPQSEPSESNQDLAMQVLPNVTVPAEVTELDPREETPGWWRQNGQRWIQRSMPTMELVRDGVAPIGRPFRHAVSILTMSQERTS